MTINLTSQTAPVTDEELDQMIWKLERDGMTPKLLSLMRELRERRKADKPTDDERLMAIEGMTHPTPVTQIKPVADLYGITSPTGSETTFTFDAGEASGFAGSGWSVQEYVELERYQEAMTDNFRENVNSSTKYFRENAETSTNSFTDDELEAMAHGNNPQANAYRELLARRNSPVTPDGWIPVSERMPETMVSVLVTGHWFHHAIAFWDGGSWCDLDLEEPVTHWQPLPAAPKEVG